MSDAARYHYSTATPPVLELSPSGSRIVAERHPENAVNPNSANPLNSKPKSKKTEKQPPPKLEIFPLIRKVLNRDYNGGRTIILLRTVSIRGNIPTLNPQTETGTPFCHPKPLTPWPIDTQLPFGLAKCESLASPETMPHCNKGNSPFWVWLLYKETLNQTKGKRVPLGYQESRNPTGPKLGSRSTLSPNFLGPGFCV